MFTKNKKPAMRAGIIQHPPSLGALPYAETRRMLFLCRGIMGNGDALGYLLLFSARLRTGLAGMASVGVPSTVAALGSMS